MAFVCLYSTSLSPHFVASVNTATEMSLDMNMPAGQLSLKMAILQHDNRSVVPQDGYTATCQQGSCNTETA